MDVGPHDNEASENVRRYTAPNDGPARNSNRNPRKQYLFTKIIHFAKKEMYGYFIRKFTELQYDTAQVNAHLSTTEESEEPSLNPFELEKNLLRWSYFSEPIAYAIQTFQSIISWKQPPVTLLLFSMYMVAIYQDWYLVIIFLFPLCIFLLTYLKNNGWIDSDGELANLSIVHPDNIVRPSNMRSQVSLLLLSGRRTQNNSGMIADIGEKINNLFLWRDPELSFQIASMTTIGFFVSLVIPPYFLFQCAAYAAGVYAFILRHFFFRYPRLCEKYDIIKHFYTRLKIDADFEKEETIRLKNVNNYTSYQRNVSLGITFGLAYLLIGSSRVKSVAM